MPTQSTHRYFVRIAKLSDHPVVQSDGLLTHDVVLAIRPDGDNAEIEVDIGNVSGESLSKCLQIRDKGEVIVDMPQHWNADSNTNWHHEIITAALDRSASESA